MRNGRTYREYKEFRERRPEAVDAGYLQACLEYVTGIDMVAKTVIVSREAGRIEQCLAEVGVDLPVEVQPGAAGFVWIEVVETQPVPVEEPVVPVGTNDQLSFF